MNEQPKHIQLMQIQTDPDQELPLEALFLIIKRKLWVILLTFFLIISLAFFYLSRTNKVYESTAVVKLPISVASSSGSGLGQILSFGQSSEINTEVELIKSRKLAENVIKEIGFDKKPEYVDLGRSKLLSIFSGRFQVARRQQTYLVEIKASGSSPGDATKLANAIANEYIRISEESSKKVWNDLITQMRKKRDEIEKELEDSRQLLRQYESKEGIDTAFSSLLLTGGTSGSMVKPENYQTIANLKSNIMQMEMRLESMRIDLPEANPQIINLKDQIANAKQKFKEEESKLLEIYNKQFGLSDFAAKVVFNQQLYTSIVSEHENLKAQFIIQYKTPEIVELAIDPAYPSSPRKMVILMVAAFFGGIAGLGVVFISEFMGKRINTPDHIERNSGIRILGRIPKLSGKSGRNNILVNGNIGEKSWVRKLYQDSHKAIRTEIISQLDSSSNSEKKGKVIVIASPMQEEGKSVISANLAISLTETMSKVVLIDVNQKHPKQKEMFGLEPDAGLVDLLLGNTSLDNAIIETDIDNLYLLSTGKSDNGHDLGGLLVSENMTKLFDKLREQFDYIVIDSTPIALASDSLAVGVKAEGLALVARMGLTQKDTLKKALQIIRNSNINLLGLILNGTPPEKRYRKYYNY